MERRLFPQALGLGTRLLRAEQGAHRREALLLQCLGRRNERREVRCACFRERGLDSLREYVVLLTLES